MARVLRQTGPAYLLICGIGLLFAVKYAPRYGLPWILGGLLYLLVFLATLWICRRPALAGFWQRPGAFYTLLLLAAAALAVGMLQYNPEIPSNGRAPAINEWLTRMLHGEYPYGAPTRPSGFPFLFVLALPFYLVREVGWLQIATFVAFGVLLYSTDKPTASEKVAVLLTSPAFLHEVIVRSELISNMIVVILYLWLFERGRPNRSLRRAFFWGLLGGLVLSTRGVVLIVYAVYFVHAYRRVPAAGAAFWLGVMLSFAGTLVPFLIWDAQRFLTDGPLGIQASYLSPLIIGAIIVGGAVYGSLARSRGTVLGASALMLLASAGIPFLGALVDTGWSQAVWHSKFDISYFCLAMPLLLAGNTPSAAVSANYSDKRIDDAR